MNKEELLTEIEWLLRDKVVGEANLYTFENHFTLLPKTYNKARRKRKINFFSSTHKTIDHRYYEIFIGMNRTVLLSTYSYTIPAEELSNDELLAIRRDIAGALRPIGE